jgi:hypothetical protein
MKMSKNYKIIKVVGVGLLPLAASVLSGVAVLLPVTAAAEEDEWDIGGFVENATYYRRDRGLSKFRNTAQLEAHKDYGEKGFFSNFSVDATFRASYDGVYDLNDDEFGKNAGGSIALEQIGVPAGVLGPGAPAIPPAQVPHGGGLGAPTNPGTPGLPPGNTLGFDLATNPNEGFDVLGEHLHPTDGGVAFGVPVRPCDVDSRGCIKGYLDNDTNDLRYSEFNDRWDFIRELYIGGDIDFDDDTQLNITFGKQQVVWGRSDLFRVLDVINPVDYSRNNIYDELEDIRIPLWMITTEYRMGATESLEDANLQLVWVIDKFRPSNIGQGGTPNAILDAGSFFRGMNNCWENGCTVANFAGGGVATDFGPGQIGIRQANLPEHSLSNTQIGFKFEGVYQGVGFSLNALTFRSQLPSLHAGIPAENAFTGQPGVFDHLIAFDINFPRVNLFGGSADFYVDSIKSAIRVEAAYTTGEEFANTIRPELYSESDVARYVIGIDRSTFIPFLNEHRAFLLSFQLFGQHILDYEREEAALGPIGIPDWENNYIMTFLAKGWYLNDRLSPQLLMAHDVKAEATTLAPSIDWLFSNNWRFTLTANIKVGTGARKFSDCRSCNPWGPFTATPAHPDPTQSGDVGLGGYEPLGRFQAGPIGMAQNEDEIQLNLRYRF